MLRLLSLLLVASTGVLAFRPEARARRLPAARGGGLALAAGSEGGLEGLQGELVRAGQGAGRLSVEPLFSVFAGDAAFRDVLWQRKPHLFAAPLPNLVGSFTMDDVKQAVDSDFIEAGRGTPLPGGGWNMASVSEPRGSSFEDAKLRFQDVQMAMAKTSGTVVFNSAGGFIPPLAAVCLQTIEAFDLPAALNMYLTSPGQKVSAPPHTDRQEVFVLQTQGQKRWRVFQPPPPGARAQADPFARGKGKDELPLADLGPPLIDTVLSPGQVLYVPAGFPHTTDTTEGVTDTAAPSVHLTVGLDAHVWGLSYAGLRSVALRRRGKPHALNLAKTSTDAYWQLQQALPLGFLALDLPQSEAQAQAQDQAEAKTEAQQRAGISAGLLARMRAAEPQRWADYHSDAELAAAIGLDEALTQVLAHHRAVTDLLGAMYADVSMKISPSKFDLSFFRSQPYFQKLEATMAGLEAWADGGAAGAGAGAGAGTGAGAGAGAAAAGSKRGFGSGAEKAGKADKADKGSKPKKGFA